MSFCPLCGRVLKPSGSACPACVLAPRRRRQQRAKLAAWVIVGNIIGLILGSIGWWFRHRAGLPW